jgi:flavin reductase (DIM6/NTAB) family NADH-FMN oxidoreductase RutF
MSSTELDVALRQMHAPVAIVGATNGQTTGGLTAAWVTRVSLDPPLILVAVGHDRYTHSLLTETDEFTVSLPRDDQVDEARLFGLESRRDVDKWSEVDHVLLGKGTPAMKDCCARYLCHIVRLFQTGDHDCFVGEVVETETLSEGNALPMRGADYAPRDK